jgi:trigger factor
MAEASTTEANACLREIEVEIPAEAVSKETQKVVRQIAKAARIPGFRPGKAPAQLIRQRYWDDIRGEVLQNLLPDSLETALKEKDFRPIARPEIIDLKFEPEEPVRYKASFEILPEITLDDYKGLSAPKGTIEMTDEDIDHELEHLREQHATFEPVEGRPAKAGDSVIATLTGTLVKPAEEAREPLELENAEIVLGADQTIKDCSEGLMGAEADEERKFDVVYPKDFNEPSLAGRTFAFTAKVTALKRKELPKLDNKLAQLAGDYKTLKDLKKAMRERMEERRGAMEKQVTEKNVLDALLAAHDFPVPAALVEQQMDSRLERHARTLMGQGIDPRTAQVDWQKIRDEQRDGAEREVRLGLLIEKIAEAEDIDASEEDVTAEIDRVSAQANQPAEALRARLTKEGGLDRIKSAVRSDKVIQFLISHAKLTTQKADKKQSAPR